MEMIKNYCKHCKRTVERTEEGRCRNCGTLLNNTGTADRHNIRRPQQGSALTINLQPQQKLVNDRYTIVKLIGTGSSKVYLAEDSVRSEQVALKMIPLVSVEMANQLKLQFESWHKVADYSHIIRLYDVHIIAYEGVVLLMVSTEYADGGTFRQWLVQNKDNACKRQTEGLYYFKQAFLGVEALHAADLVHGNLKPESLGFVGETLKVMGPGLSRYMRNIQSSYYNNQRPGLEISPERSEYGSPEQNMTVHHGDIDISSDIYSLGVMLHETCHPKSILPFESTYHQLHLPAPALKDAGVNAARVVARCLQKDPGARYETVSQLIDDLEGSCNTKASQTSHAGTPQPTGEADELWEEACEFMESNNLDEAGRLCDRILDTFGEHNQARAMRHQIDSRYAQAGQIYETIRNGLGNQTFAQLSTLLVEAVGIYPDHPDGILVQTQLLSVRDTVDNGIEAFSEGYWQQAQANFERARELNPGSNVIAELVDFTNRVRGQIETARARVDAAIQQRDWTGAMSWARGIDRYVGEVKGMVVSLRNQG
jgi:serine/threonine protein kinase